MSGSYYYYILYLSFEQVQYVLLNIFCACLISLDINNLKGGNHVFSFFIYILAWALITKCHKVGGF